MAEERAKPGSDAGTTRTEAPASSDPSMEDILASIRRILNEEEAASGTDTATSVATPTDETLTLSEDMLVADTAPAAPPQDVAATREAEAASHVTASLPRPAEAPAPPPTPAPPTFPPAPSLTPAEEAGLLAPTAAAAAAASVSHLLRTVAAERGTAVSRGGPTIEDLVREELRPLLKDWLDQHLPAVVERLVRAEIERVVGRALS